MVAARRPKPRRQTYGCGCVCLTTATMPHRLAPHTAYSCVSKFARGSLPGRTGVAVPSTTKRAAAERCRDAITDSICDQRRKP